MDVVANRATPADSYVLAEFVPAHTRIATLAVVVLPFLGLIAGILLLWRYDFRWAQLGIFLLMFYLTGFGITLGYHRLFTHRSFATVRPIQLILGILGSMAVEGPLLKWVAMHRRHHQYSDTHGDPHSPNLEGKGFLAMLCGLWHAHMGWLFARDAPGLSRYIGDLLSDRMLRTVSRLFPLWVILSMLIPAALGGLLSGTWPGALMGFIWGGLARVFLVHHMTWSINSVCHLWGRRPFRSHDRSRNNLLFGILGLGEGWHNNHHAFPASARHGLAWWQIDVTYLVIRALEAIGLAWKVRLPSAEAVAEKLCEQPSRT